MSNPNQSRSALNLDRESGLPLYLQIAHDFMYRLEMGLMRTGEMLPSIRDLAAKLRVSPLTVDKAYKWLCSRGVVSSRPGIGWEITVPVNPSAEGDRERLRIRQFVDLVLSEAAEKGLDPLNIAQTLLRRAMAMQRTVPIRRLIFIECHPDYLEDYTAELKRELADLNVEISGLLSSALQKCGNRSSECHKIIAEADYVLTTLYHFEGVRRALSGFKNLRVVVVSHTIDKEALLKILSLPPNTSLGAVLGPQDPAPAIVHTLELYRDLPPGSIQFAVISDTKALSGLLRKVQAIAYTAACQAQIGPLVKGNVNVIQLRFVPDEEAITKIRALLNLPTQSQFLGSVPRPNSNGRSQVSSRRL